MVFLDVLLQCAQYDNLIIVVAHMLILIIVRYNVLAYYLKTILSHACVDF